MATDSARPTPPRQTDTDPTAADRRLSEKQKDALKNEPAPPKPDCGANLPDPDQVVRQVSALSQSAAACIARRHQQSLWVCRICMRSAAGGRGCDETTTLCTRHTGILVSARVDSA
ncbi:MAG: hypothetical protein CPDRYDRY_5503 [uncultured Paraburkholderia sp.]|nr:MAG: hypothetical protein CPDRYDRY_5503 [uncultured Paraburkholderia sp.]